MYSTARRAGVDQNAEGRRVVAVDDVVLRLGCRVGDEPEQEAAHRARCAGLQARFAAATGPRTKLCDSAAKAGVQ